MKRMKKLFAVLLALSMVLGMSATAFAEGEETDNSKNAAIIQGVEPEEGVEVVAYQIIKYNTNGYYEEVLAGTIDKEEVSGQQPTLKPSAENVQNLYYNKLSELKLESKKVTFEKQKDSNYTCTDLDIGTWLVVVNGAKNTIYNPAIISVSKTSDGVEYGTLNLDVAWTNNVYLKKDEPGITKTAESADGKDLNVVGTQFGNILKFTISADIPAYTERKTNIEYAIKDTLTGLDFVIDDEHPVSAKIGDVDNSTVKSKAEQAIKDAIDNKNKTFTVTDFENQFLIENANKKITIVYYAKVTSTELVNVDKLNNTASLKYSNNTDTTQSSNETSTETKHYTFGIDTKVTGWKDSTVSNNTGEFIKINDKGEVSYNETPGAVTTKSGTELLEGAEFQLHIGTKDGPIFTDKQNKSTFTTDKEGRLQIVGLDDGVDYYLVETKAPEGYTLNATPIKVRINATYGVDSKTNLQDILVSYEVVIGEGDNKGTTHYKYEYKTGETEFINTKETPSNPYGFKNTKLTELPSTGGIGTTIFTIGGCIIMIIAAGLFFASRRKKAEN